jgi:exodeoxyribonuclease-5
MTPFALTQDQQAALDAIDTFLADPTATCFLLEGGAGVGKSTLVGEVLRRQRFGVKCCCAPTHKAVEVLRRKLDALRISWCWGYDPFSFSESDVVTGTSAALLGISPIVEENQTDTEVRFGKTGRGILGKVFPRLLVIDEVSMLAWRDCGDLIKRIKTGGGKILLVGDAAQLPPVRAIGIPFDRFTHHYTLRQVVRQAEGSAIVQLAWALRDGKPWRSIEGPGLERVGDVGAAFVEHVVAPGASVEEDRSVFLAYRNSVVDAVQERACRKVYGHGAQDFAAGELVVSDMAMYDGKTLLCANQSDLVVKSIHEGERDEMYGLPCMMKHARGGRTFRAFYLSARELADPNHPYNIELTNLRQEAMRLQAEFKALHAGDSRRGLIDSQRKAAWGAFFGHKDQSVLSFRHGFACTSHRAQGSTYREVFADTVDLSRFSAHSLYVAVTRPRLNLVVPA